MIVVTIQNSQQHSEHRFDAPEVVLGRYPNAAGPNVVIDDSRVSRRQLLLRPVSDTAIRLENVGRAELRLTDGYVVKSGEKCELPLPTRMKCGNTEIQISALLVDQPDDGDVLSPTSSGYHSLPREVPFSAPAEALQAREKLGEAPTAERLAVWFETLLTVQRAAAGSTEFYDETAKALVHLVGLDRGLVLLREQGAWKTVAGHARDELIGLHFSRSVLGKVLDDKCTLYGNPDEIASAASLLRVEAVVASPILDEAGGVVGVLYGSRDLVATGARTEITSLDAQMVQILAAAASAGLVRLRMQDKLKSAEQLAAVGQAIGYIIHDLRGPLGNARQLVGMLREGDTITLSREEQLDFIGQSVDVSLELLNDSLEFCRGNVVVAPVRGSVLELLRKHVQLLRIDLTALQVALKLEIPVDLKAVLDPARMARVLRNLARNAGEALKGRPGAAVEIGARGVSGGIELWVADNGPGLPEQVREKLFQPFATQGKRGGTGFGLAIAKQLVEAHQGHIRVTTDAGGTRFIIFLPEVVPLPVARPLISDNSTVSLSASVSTDTSARVRKRLLLAEDGVVNQKLISGLLKNAGHEVTIAADGRQALAALAAGHFDLVLMDLEMPVMNGLEAARAIRAQETVGGKRLPIVALTAHETAETRQACREAAMDGYLEKPVRPEALARLIDELCGHGPSN